MRLTRMRFKAIAHGFLWVAAAVGCATLHPGRAHGTSPTPLRVATFNLQLSDNGGPGDLAARLATTTDSQARFSAEIIQRVNPDVIVLTEFDFDAGGLAIGRYQQNYLGVAKNGQAPVQYDHVYFAPVNTGVQPETIDPAWDFDFDNNGNTDDPDDAFGFGNYPGQYGMVVLSKHPIQTAGVRTFQEFLWKDMPGNVIPSGFFTADELDAFRLSSKSHWDVPITVDGKTVQLLASHPTPPVFDSVADENGRRNHDEIRLWADYVTPGAAGYLHDDAGGTGGLSTGASFVVLGDLNADPDEGDSFDNAIDQLLSNPRINGDFVPLRPSGIDLSDTATFGLRADYVLPSADLPVEGGGVFWPGSFADDGYLASLFASDHRLVYVDVLVPEPGSAAVLVGLSAVLLVGRRRHG